MCLLKNSSKLKATKDIVCYKVCRYIGGGIYSFYYDKFKWVLNKEYEADRATRTYTRNNVYDGYFHTYKSLSTALSSLEIDIDSRIKIVKCIIPKGSYYYKGWHSPNIYGYLSEGYASKKLKIVEIVN